MGKRSTLPTIAGPHHADHEPGGLDEVVDIDILNTGVLLSAHETRHRLGGADPLNHDNLAGYVAAEHLSLPNTIANVLTDHNVGAHPVSVGGTGLSTIAAGGILYATALDVLARLAPTAANQVLRSTAANALQFAALVAADIPNLDASKITSGVFDLARIPAIDDARIPDVETLSYTNPFALAQIPAHHTTHESGGADEIKDMELNPAPGADNTGSGILTVDTVGETVAAGEVLYMASTGKYMKAKGDAVGTMPAVVLAMESISADATGKLLHMGYYRHDAWNWATIGGLLYVSEATAGALTQTRPSTTGNQVQICGYAVTADVVYFAPGLEIVEIS